MMLAQLEYMNNLHLDLAMFDYPHQEKLYKFSYENRRAWSNLKIKRVKDNKKIKYLQTDNCGNVYPFDYYESSTFINVHTIFATHCDKNFVYHWLNNNNFPNLQTLYLMNHPCTPSVLQQKDIKIIMDSHWNKYKERWDVNDRIEIRNRDEIINYMDTFETINIELLD